MVETNRAFRTPKMFHEFVLDGLQKYRACFSTSLSDTASITDVVGKRTFGRCHVVRACVRAPVCACVCGGGGGS